MCLEIQELLHAIPPHLKLGGELCKDAKEGLCGGGLAVLPEVGRHFAELLHGPLLE